MNTVLQYFPSSRLLFLYSSDFSTYCSFLSFIKWIVFVLVQGQYMKTLSIIKLKLMYSLTLTHEKYLAPFKFFYALEAWEKALESNSKLPNFILFDHLPLALLTLSGITINHINSKLRVIYFRSQNNTP